MKSIFTVVELDTIAQSDFLIISRHCIAFASVVDRVRKISEEKVVVHCIAGVNRSVCLCVAYLMIKCHLDPLETL